MSVKLILLMLFHFAHHYTAYDSSKETCCVGNGLDIPGGGGVLKGTGACCGTSFKKAKTYDVTTKLCCGGKLVDKSKSTFSFVSCCWWFEF